MARILSLIIYVLTLNAVLLIIPTTCHGHLQHPEKPVAFFIFGDSVLDPGNNNYINTTIKANFPPYGENFFKHPTGRVCDGRLISDFLAEYAKLPLIPPFLQPGAQFSYGANFASAGAGALDETFQGLVVNLNTQLEYFKKVRELVEEQDMGDVEAKKTISGAVYFISIGSNDYLSPFLNGFNWEDSSSHRLLVERVIGNLTIVLKEIYKSGGRKFGFLNVGPLGCIPLARALKPENKGACIEDASQLARLHNVALSKLLKELEKQLPGFKYSNSEFYDFISQRMNHPLKYGFKEGKTACCGTGPFRGINSCGGRRTVKEYQLCEDARDYVFWDSGHPSEKAYEQLAKQMWSGTQNGVGPYNLKDLFQAV